MWPEGVVVDTPLLDQDLGLTQAVEDFAVEQLVAEPGVGSVKVKSSSTTKGTEPNREYSGGTTVG